MGSTKRDCTPKSSRDARNPPYLTHGQFVITHPHQPCRKDRGAPPRFLPLTDIHKAQPIPPFPVTIFEKGPNDRDRNSTSCPHGHGPASPNARNPEPPTLLVEDQRCRSRGLYWRIHVVKPAVQSMKATCARLSVIPEQTAPSLARTPPSPTPSPKIHPIKIPIKRPVPQTNRCTFLLPQPKHQFRSYPSI